MSAKIMITLFAFVCMGSSALKLVVPSGKSGLNRHIAAIKDERLLQLRAKEQLRGKQRLLIFWSVGSGQRTQDLVTKNLNHLRATHRDNLDVDVYLAHYDSNQSAWLDGGRMGDGKDRSNWYQDNIAFSAQQSGHKFQLMKSLLTKKFDLESYSWVWSLDEDIDFTQTDIARFIELADQSGSLVVLPAFTKPHGSLWEELRSWEETLAAALPHATNSTLKSYPMQEVHPDCLYRHAPVVEYIAPIIKGPVLKTLLTSCEGCIHPDTNWGLDRVWCSWTANKYQHDKETACAIIDETPVAHFNFKTLPGKYEKNVETGKLERHDGFTAKAREDFEEVKNKHPKDFVDGNSALIKATSCMGLDGQMKAIRSDDQQNFNTLPGKYIKNDESVER